jgi:hypothetical protein
MSGIPLGLSDDERQLLSEFKDDEALTEEQRIKKLKEYLEPIHLRLKLIPTGLGGTYRKSIDQIVVDWAQEKGFDQGTYM